MHITKKNTDHPECCHRVETEYPKNSSLMWNKDESGYYTLNPNHNEDLLNGSFRGLKPFKLEPNNIEITHQQYLTDYFTWSHKGKKFTKIRIQYNFIVGDLKKQENLIFLHYFQIANI